VQVPTPDTTRQQCAAYGLVVDDRRRVLLVRASRSASVPGVWYPPGGGVEYGEHPEQAVLRELREETGYTGRVVELVTVLSDTTDAVHTIRLIYRLEVISGDLRDEAEGSSDRAAWITPEEAARLTLAGFFRSLLP
jgi:ADP-ribose pyrophosphatase YjhB (NUDIX family)